MLLRAGAHALHRIACYARCVRGQQSRSTYWCGGQQQSSTWCPAPSRDPRLVGHGCAVRRSVVVRLHDDGGGGGAGAGAGRDDGGRPPGSGLLSAAAAAAVNRGWYSAARAVPACHRSCSLLPRSERQWGKPMVGVLRLHRRRVMTRPCWSTHRSWVLILPDKAGRRLEVGCMPAPRRRASTSAAAR